MGGQIIDATVVPAPKQRNTEAEKTAIKAARSRNTGRPSRQGFARRIAMRAEASSIARSR
jgi:hypothetical protein